MFPAEQTAAIPAVYKQLADSNAWSLLAPEITVAGLSLLVLADGLLLKKSRAWLTPVTVKFFLLLLAGFTVANLVRGAGAEGPAFGGLVMLHGRFSDVARLFFLATAFAVTHLASGYLGKRNLPRHEYLHLTLVATAAMMLLVQANHFVLFFLALETVAVVLYVLVGYNRKSGASLEAGVKYLITGGLSSALLLAGIVLLTGAGGNTLLNPHAGAMDMFRFDHLQVFVTAHADLAIVKAGVALTLAGVAFKLGAFPFNVWIPDVYQGAPAPTTAFLAVGSKGAGVFALILLTVLTNAPFRDIDPMLVKILVPVAGLTLLFGNLPALGQRNVKRLLGLSGMSHAGWLLIGVLAAIASPDADARYLAVVAVIAYLFAYLLGSTLVFGVINHVAGEEDSEHTLDDYRRLYARSPFLAGILATGLGSLAGAPPTLGFVAKLLIVIAAFGAGLYAVTILALACVVTGVYYYFGWLREAFHRSPESDAPAPIEVGRRSRVILGVAAALTLFGFLAQLTGCGL